LPLLNTPIKQESGGASPYRVGGWEERHRLKWGWGKAIA